MEIAILFALIFLNGLFAMSEIALVTARKARLQKLIDEGDSGAVAAVKLGEDPTRFLSTIQIGITSIGVLNGIVGEAALAAPLAAWLERLGVPLPYGGYAATGLVVVLITYFSIVVGELVPKRIRGALFAAYVEKSLKDVAFNAAQDDFQALDKLPNLDKGKPVIFACNGAECWKSYKAAKVAAGKGFKSVYWLRGGLPEWDAAGLPTEGG